MPTMPPGQSSSPSITITPATLRWARYMLGANGEFIARGQQQARKHEPIVIGLAGNARDSVTVTYTSSAARIAAAELLGYAHQLGARGPVPDHLMTTLLEPDERTATGTTWHLSPGLTLHYTAPCHARLTAEATEWPLTAALATRWAQALLAVAAELDHAHAIATQAVLADRAGRTPPQTIRAWLDSITAELTVEQAEFADRLRDVLADEASITHGQALHAALDLAHPDLPTSLADLRLLSRDTITHRDAADVIEQLASLYALPISLWTAASGYIRAELDGGMLTEREWQRVGRTREMGVFDAMVDNEQANNGAAIDVRLALYQAGVLCRECGTRITGEIADTLGRCDQCRPTDAHTALTQVLAAGCCGEYTDHVRSSSGACMDCGLPLPENYHLLPGPRS